ncbi:hypothetical protein [Caenimonas sp. SL110]|uniref:hypothetical protein n=1 Tax=Caenimonas sp. SL110 TaxID=1450524 RepID=UPI00069D430C|nr:hypothetical protein [Caenimonas sp. SL110]
MSILKSLFARKSEATNSASDLDDSGRTRPQKMNLDERMAYRREMLFEAIRHGMDSFDIAPHCYRFRVTPIDKRGHAYAVMITLAREFLDDPRAATANLQQIGKAIAKLAGSGGLIEVSGVYWNVHERADGFGARHGGSSLSEPGSTRPPVGVQERTVEKRTYATDIAPLPRDDR